MKKIAALFILLILFNCKEEIVNHVKLSGKIENPHESKTLTVLIGENADKTIIINEDGTYSDTLNIAEENNYYLKHGDNYLQVYLKNGYDISITADNNDFEESVIFKGDANNVFNFNNAYYPIEEKLYNEITDNPSLENFETASSEYRKQYDELLKAHNIIDSTQLAKLNTYKESTITYRKYYVDGKIQLKKDLPKGMVSPSFENYKNYNGGTTSLSELKGKYIYVDLWATWCGPCIQEFPALKKIESRYHDKNIAFVGISMDSPRYHGNDSKKAKMAWKNFIKENEVGGIQLITDKGFESDFIKGYKITYIPRYIIIDPDGNIIDPDAPRPSNPRLITIFNELNI